MRQSKLRMHVVISRQNRFPRRIEPKRILYTFKISYFQHIVAKRSVFILGKTTRMTCIQYKYNVIQVTGTPPQQLKASTVGPERVELMTLKENATVHDTIQLKWKTADHVA